MRLLVDGYNLVYAALETGLLGELTDMTAIRERLLGVLVNRFGPQAGDITVIFDGVRPRHLPESPNERLVYVIYAGPKREADAVIEKLLADDHGARQLGVVSSDRRLQQAAARRRAHVIKSEDFVRELQQRAAIPAPGAAPQGRSASAKGRAAQPKGNAAESQEKLHGSRGQQAEEWAEIFGADELDQLVRDSDSATRRDKGMSGPRSPGPAGVAPAAADSAEETGPGQRHSGGAGADYWLNLFGISEDEVRAEEQDSGVLDADKEDWMAELDAQLRGDDEEPPPSRNPPPKKTDR